MLSYLHEYHAGNHADLLKHVTLFYVLEYLNKKQKPYTFIDTHSGSGLYYLDSDESLKTGEAQKGIKTLLFEVSKKKENVPKSLFSYIDFVSEFMKKNLYPGSPTFEICKSFEKSNIFLCELHKKQHEKLLKKSQEILDFRKIVFDAKECYVNVLNEDGWKFLMSNVPPQLKRGAVLCDPSFEENSDYIFAAKNLCEVHRRWNGSTIMLWYPLLANKIDKIEDMKQSILSFVKNKDSHVEVLDAQLLVDEKNSHIETSLKESIGSEKPRLYGSGMFVVNPSWGLSEYLKEVLPYISKTVGVDGKSFFSVEML